MIYRREHTPPLWLSLRPHLMSFAIFRSLLTWQILRGSTIPVVPEVYMMVAGSSAFGGTGSAGLPLPSSWKESQLCTSMPCSSVHTSSVSGPLLCSKTVGRFGDVLSRTCSLLCAHPLLGSWQSDASAAHLLLCFQMAL